MKDTTKHRIALISLVIILLLNTMPALCKTWHVSPEGNDDSDGSSWTNSILTPQIAMDKAQSGDEIWIAAGTYSPTHIRQVDGESLFTASFVMKDGVSIYGGFQGDETAISQREMSEEAGAWSFRHKTILTVSAEMPGTVLYCGIDGFTTATVIDGFTITGGCAMGSTYDGYGGGAVISANTEMRKCVIKENFARNGGGVAMFGNARLTQCLISCNELAEEGWGGEGGGIKAIGNGGVIANSLIHTNGNDGGVFSGGGIHADGNVTIQSCTIAGNMAPRQGSGVALLSTGAAIRNTIIWGNMGTMAQLHSRTFTIDNCAIEGATPTSTCIPLESENAGPNGTSANDNWVDGYYICFVNPEAGNFQLDAGSYAINRGCDTGATADADNVQRLQCQLEDIGAFESPFKGNLAIDFAVDFPCIYRSSSFVTPVLGLCSPADISISFHNVSGRVTWSNVNESWKATWLAAETAEPQMTAAPRDSSAWKTAILTRELDVAPRTIILMADDQEFIYGDDFPELTWSIHAGSLADGDSITGAPECTIQDTLDKTYPITIGTLAVHDGNYGRNYKLQFLDGMLFYQKAEAQISIAASDIDYTGKATDITTVTSPGDLHVTVIYTGTNGTSYGPSSTPPADCGDYVAILTVEDPHYSGQFETAITISPATLTITAKDASRMYLMPNPEFTYKITGFKGDDSAADITLPSISTTAIQSSPAGKYPINISGGGARNYIFDLQEATLTITKASLLVEVQASAIVYGDSIAKSLITGVARHSGNGMEVSGDFLWENENEAPDAGTYERTWLFIPDDTDNFQTSTGTTFITVAAKAIEIKADDKFQVFGDEPQQLTFTVIAGELMEGEAFTVALQRQPGNNAGIYEITAGTLSASANYKLTVHNGTYTITPREITVTINDAQKTYGDNDPVFLFTITKGNLAGESILQGTPERQTGENAGIYTISGGSISVSDNDNYHVTFIPGTFRITRAMPNPAVITIATDSYTYGKPLSYATLNGTFTSSVTDAPMAGMLTWVTPNEILPVGQWKPEWCFQPFDSTNYNVLKGTADITVTPASLQVFLLTPYPSRPYKTAELKYPLYYSGFVNGENETALSQLPIVSCPANYYSLPGKYPITISGGKADNYTITYTTGELTIVPKQAAINSVVTAKEIKYGQTLSEATLSGTIKDADTNEIVPGVLSWLGAPTDIPIPGTARFCIFMPDSPGYSQSIFQVPLSVIPRKVIIDPYPKHKFYKEANQPLYWEYFFGSETILPNDHLDIVLSREPGEDAGKYKFQLSSWNHHPGYELQCYNSTFTIMPKTVWVYPNEVTKVYGDPDPELTLDYSPGKMPEGVTFTGSLEREPGEDVGNYYIYQGTLASESPNYDVNVPPTRFKITKRTITATVSESTKSKNYGEPDPEFKVDFSGGIDGVPIPVSGSITRNPNDNAGSHSFRIGTLAITDPNYELVMPQQFFTINKLKVTVTIDNCTKYNNEPDPVFTYSVTSGTVLPDDNFSGRPSRLSGSNPGTYNITQGTLSLGKNYDLTVVNGVLTVLKDELSLVITHVPTITYGQKFNEIQIQGYAVRPYNNTIINGTFRWTDANLVPVSGIYNSEVTFYPDPRTGFRSIVFMQSGTVLKRRIKVVADDCTIEYGDPRPQFTSSIVEGEMQCNEHLSYNLQVNTDSILPGKYDIYFDDVLPMSNYDIEYVTGTLTILNKKVTIKADDTNKTADEIDPELTWSIVDGGFGYSESVYGELNREIGEEPGTYRILGSNLRLPAYHDVTFQEGVFTIHDANGQTRGASANPISDTAETPRPIHDTVTVTKDVSMPDLGFYPTLEQALEAVNDGGNVLVATGSHTAINGKWDIDRNIHISAMTTDQEDAPVLSGTFVIHGNNASGTSISGIDLISQKGPALVIADGATGIVIDNTLISGDVMAINTDRVEDIVISGCLLNANTTAILSKTEPAQSTVDSIQQDNTWESPYEIIW